MSIFDWRKKNGEKMEQKNPFCMHNQRVLIISISHLYRYSTHHEASIVVGFWWTDSGQKSRSNYWQRELSYLSSSIWFIHWLAWPQEAYHMVIEFQKKIAWEVRLGITSGMEWTDFSHFPFWTLRWSSIFVFGTLFPKYNLIQHGRLLWGGPFKKYKNIRTAKFCIFRGIKQFKM